jgi:hypothetical protein
LSNEHVFHRFLDGEVSWVSIFHTCPLVGLLNFPHSQKSSIRHRYPSSPRTSSRRHPTTRPTRMPHPPMPRSRTPLPPIRCEIQTNGSKTRRCSRTSLLPM